MAVIQTGPDGISSQGLWPGFPWVDAVRDYGAVGDGLADDTAAIQAAITQACTGLRKVYLPAGRYRITSTLRIACEDFWFWGDGTGHNHGPIGFTTPILTHLAWNGVLGGTMLEVMPNPGSMHLGGINIRGIGFDGSSTITGGGPVTKAARGLHVRSCIHSEFRAYVERCTQAGVYADCWNQAAVGGPNAVSVGSWADVQDCLFDIEGRMEEADDGAIAWFTGDEWTGTSSADFSVNHRIWVRGSYGGGANAHGVVVGNSDNNTFCSVDAFDNSAGATGAHGLWLKGHDTLAGATCRNNRFSRVGTYRIKIDGTDEVANPAQFNYIEWQDKQGNPLVLWGANTHTNHVWMGESFYDVNHWRHPYSVNLNSDFSTTSTSFVDVVDANTRGLRFAVRIGWIYEFRFEGTYTTTDATNGLALTIAGPSVGGSNVRALLQYATAGPATIASEWITALGGGTGTTTTDLANNRRFWEIRGVYQCMATGYLSIQVKRQGAGAGTIAVQMGAGGSVNPARQAAALGLS